VRVQPESGFLDASFCCGSLLLASVLTRTAASIVKDPFIPLGAGRNYSCFARSALNSLTPLQLKFLLAITGSPSPTQQVSLSQPRSGSLTRKCGLRSQLVVVFYIKVNCEDQDNHLSEM